MKIDLISTGTELLTGKANTNAAFIGLQLLNLGLELYSVIDISDRKKDLICELERSLSRSDAVIVTGGLGPTFDDITVETVAQCLGLPIYSDKSVLEDIAAFFKKRNIDYVSNNNNRQANIIEGAEILKNKNGTAPGQKILCKYKDAEKAVFLFPGPPRELQPLFKEYAEPFFKSKVKGFRINRSLQITGLGESRVEEIISPIIKETLSGSLKDNVEFGILAHGALITVKFSAIGDSQDFVEKISANLISKIEYVLKDYIFGYDFDSIENVVGKLLKERKETLALAESCTGGLLSQRITNIAGSSEYFKNAFIVYSNEAKEKFLGVKKETLEKYGAVSSETAKEMAEGALKVSVADYAVSVTGIAGPGGASKEKPVGLVYIGAASKNKTETFKYNFIGNRLDIRERAANTALDILRKTIKQNCGKK